jgi:hypothetical protein
MEILIAVSHIVISLIALKALWLGSDFSFYYWLRDGKKYTSWYSNRETYRR